MDEQREAELVAEVRRLEREIHRLHVALGAAERAEADEMVDRLTPEDIEVAVREAWARAAAKAPARRPTIAVPVLGGVRLHRHFRSGLRRWDIFASLEVRTTAPGGLGDQHGLLGIRWLHIGCKSANELAAPAGGD